MLDKNRTILLENYRPPAYLVETIELDFQLDPQRTVVSSVMQIRRNPAGDGGPLQLDGEHLELLELQLDGRQLGQSEYTLTPEGLLIGKVGERFEVRVRTACNPGANAALEGLYISSDMYCTQCEAEGFRRITYYPDRPDVMARFTVTVSGDPQRCPVMLSNGNREAEGRHDDGRHWVRWRDPFPKPSYLFALVAGDLVRLEDSFTTASGRAVALHLYVQQRNADKGEFALTSLKQAMAWDEERFGREYDLDLFMIVAVDDFNMGAMENKGLNIFNSSCVLARPESATDQDFMTIQSIVGHEYFHNWTGNRVTCRDWFQLSLKEGLTVYRDQEFSADLNSRAIQRIQDVNMLRTHQFAEDEGPMAHPVRPDRYEEINNFYTTTVYNKGAEVVRMLQELVGREGFRRGMDLYFERHDGRAVTVEDFLAAIGDANGADLEQFALWYRQAGTPGVTASYRHDAQQQTFELTLEQTVPPTPGQPDKQPMVIPVRTALIAADGTALPLRLEEDAATGGSERVLLLTRARQTFRFLEVSEPPLPSLLRGFSAPVNLKLELEDEALAFLWQHDDDGFRRWEAGQLLAERTIGRMLKQRAGGLQMSVPEAFIAAFAGVLADDGAETAFLAEALTLPNESYLAGRFQPADPGAIHQAREALRATLAEHLSDALLATYTRHHQTGEFRLDGPAIGGRALKNLCLAYLAAGGRETGVHLAEAQYREASTMTDALAALRAACAGGLDSAGALLQDFYDRWEADPLVIDKWFSLQATHAGGETLARVRALLEHKAFTLRNPNRVRALIGALANGNPSVFHHPSGEGYWLLADQIRELDSFNPQIAARLTLPLTRWRRVVPALGQQMKSCLMALGDRAEVSRDLREVVNKGLAES